jgi:hypothetical protein
MRRREQSQVPARRRILARVLADELPRVRVAGGVGPTSIGTQYGAGKDITNLDGDNDGPLDPPPV